MKLVAVFVLLSVAVCMARPQSSDGGHTELDFSNKENGFIFYIIAILNHLVQKTGLSQRCAKELATGLINWSHRPDYIENISKTDNSFVSRMRRHVFDGLQTLNKRMSQSSNGNQPNDDGPEADQPDVNLNTERGLKFYITVNLEHLVEKTGLSSKCTKKLANGIINWVPHDRSATAQTAVAHTAI